MKTIQPAVCIYDFQNGKIVNVRVFQDRLTVAQQATKGIAKWMVNMIVNATQKGLK
jgi:predicted Fe-Mo cluster-binding NifX family protein